MTKELKRTFRHLSAFWGYVRYLEFDHIGEQEPVKLGPGLPRRLRVTIGDNSAAT